MSLIVEGETSRSGVGNDLFSGADSVSRIVCPSKNAFAKCDDILEEILEHVDDKLVLLMLGPTAKVLAVDLMQRGYQAIDLGHIDSEYEWFQMKATSKVKLDHKHIAEHNFDTDIQFIEDADYLYSVKVWVGVAPQTLQEVSVKEVHEVHAVPSLISIIVPVYNVKLFLNRCIDSLLKQTYPHFELILINNGMMESFFGILKSEMFYGLETSYQSLDELEEVITDFNRKYDLFLGCFVWRNTMEYYSIFIGFAQNGMFL